jgi:Cu(I)/Ag(I) efflux system membrane fusion protein
MGLPDTSPVPKKDSMGMDYIPVYAEDTAEDTGTVRISPERVQVLGVRTEPVLHRDLSRTIRAAGTVRFDERRTFVVSTRFEGWIERLLVNATGDEVTTGQPLMLVYSPELLLAQEEFALLRNHGNGIGGNSETARRLLDGARGRLKALDFPSAELRRLEAEGTARRLIALPSPVSGTVVEKPAVQGMRFMAGERLFTIVDLSTVWMIAEVFEQDLAEVAVGNAVAIRAKAYPGKPFAGQVAFISPTVNPVTRTVPVRIEIPNRERLLKAEMYADVEIAAPASRGAVLAVPDSAVIDSGTRQVVLIDRGEGRFQPRPVRLGARAQGMAEVLDGLVEGDCVVVSANFLIDAESNLKAALQGFSGHEGHQ